MLRNPELGLPAAEVPAGEGEAVSDAAWVQQAIRECKHLHAGLCYRCAEKLMRAYAAEQTAALRASTIQDAAAIADKWEHAYPPDIFIEPPPGQHGQTVDGCSARAARHVAHHIAAEIRALEVAP